MAAEGLVRSGGSEGTARSYLNQVRGRVSLSPVSSTGSDLLEDIYDERRFELATEGHRFFDLLRTGKATDVLGDQGFVLSNYTNTYRSLSKRLTRVKEY